MGLWLKDNISEDWKQCVRTKLLDASSNETLLNTNHKNEQARLNKQTWVQKSTSAKQIFPSI